VLKYADNLTKGFSTSAAVLLAAAASSVTFGFVPTRAFLVGSAVACAAFYLYFGEHNAFLLERDAEVRARALGATELASLKSEGSDLEGGSDVKEGRGELRESRESH